MDILNQRFVRQCAPTLAGIKVGSLFCCDRSEIRLLCPALSSWKIALQNKGIETKILRIHNGHALIYVYRKRQLEKLLFEPEIQTFLQGFGYPSGDLSDALSYLIRRIEENGSFPHEIGVFLGYPLGDIKGFIENHGKNYKICGCWKVYEDEIYAQKMFKAFQDCRENFCQLFEQGCSIPSLAKAA